MTNREVYSQAENVDTVISGVVVYTTYKVFKNLYAASLGQPWYPFYTAGYALLSYIQTKYLMAAYLNNVFLIDEMSICGD